MSDFSPPDTATWERLRELFDEEPDGYLRFRRSLLRDSAYEGLPYRLRRQLHGAVAARLEAEIGIPRGGGGRALASLLRGRRVSPGLAVRNVAAKRSGSRLCIRGSGQAVRPRAGDAGRQIDDIDQAELAAVHGYDRATHGTKQASSARHPKPTSPRAGWWRANPFVDAELLLKLSHVEEKRGQSNRRSAGPRRLEPASKDFRPGSRPASRAVRCMVRHGASEGRPHDRGAGVGGANCGGGRDH